MTPYYTDDLVTLLLGDALETLRALPDGSADCCVTSPPYYGLRDYGVEGQYGLEASVAEYVERMVGVFAETRRVLSPTGTLWLNLGDSYANLSPGGAQGRTGQRAGRTFTATGSGGRTDLPAKNLLGMPWRVALALQADSWVLRNAIVWHKPNALPTSAKDRFATRYELVFLLAPAPRYRFDLEAVKEPARSTKPAGNSPESLAAYGAATGTARGVDLNRAYHDMAVRRFAQGVLPPAP